LQRSADAVRITAQLKAAATGRTLWAQSYDGEMHQILALQDRVAQSIAERLRIRALPLADSTRNRRQEISPAAYEAFVRGSHFGARVPRLTFRRASATSSER
jgi:hypothetical protein